MNLLSHEAVIHENAPEPAQIRKLASVGVGSAASRHRLKSLNSSKRAHYFVEEVDLLSEMMGEDESSFPQEVRHRMAGRVGLNLVNGYSKVWSLNYFDTYWVNSENGGWQASRALYRFKWDRSRTLLAQRTLRYIGNQGSVERDMADDLDNLRLMDDEAAIWSAREDFSRVTAEDCESLIEDSQEYFSLVESQYQAR